MASLNSPGGSTLQCGARRDLLSYQHSCLNCNKMYDLTLTTTLLSCLTMARRWSHDALQSSCIFTSLSPSSSQSTCHQNTRWPITTSPFAFDINSIRSKPNPGSVSLRKIVSSQAHCSCMGTRCHRQYSVSYHQQVRLNLKKNYSTQRIKNDASARPPNLTSASCDLDLWPHDPKN